MFHQNQNSFKNTFLIMVTLQSQETERQFGNTVQTTRSTHLFCERSDDRTQFSLPCIKNVNKPKSRAARTVYVPIFLLFHVIIVFCQYANKTGSNFAITGCNLSKNHKLAQYKTQSGELKFFFNIFLRDTCTKTWVQICKYYRASCLVGGYIV